MIKNNRLTSNFFINKKFQFSVIGNILLVQFLCLGFLYLAIFRYFSAIRMDALNSGLTDSSPIVELINNLQSTMNSLLFFVLVTMSFIITLGGMWLSHKVAGPLHRLNGYLRNYDPESSSEIKFRKGDFFLEIQDAVNLAMKKGKEEK